MPPVTIHYARAYFIHATARPAPRAHKSPVTPRVLGVFASCMCARVLDEGGKFLLRRAVLLGSTNELVVGGRLYYETRDRTKRGVCVVALEL